MATIREISDRYELSRDHLMKIAQKLSNASFIETVRGKNGGIRLECDPGTVVVGDIVRTMEGRDFPAFFYGPQVRVWPHRKLGSSANTLNIIRCYPGYFML